MLPTPSHTLTHLFPNISLPFNMFWYDVDFYRKQDLFHFVKMTGGRRVKSMAGSTGPALRNIYMYHACSCNARWRLWNLHVVALY